MHLEITSPEKNLFYRKGIIYWVHGFTLVYKSLLFNRYPNIMKEDTLPVLTDWLSKDSTGQGMNDRYDNIKPL